ncbi:MAG: hypothetical protein ACOYIB_07815, partial [Desulfosporosinus sp.]
IPYTKETYEGILVSADTNNNKYKIGIQLGENLVLQVDEVNDTEIRNSLREWAPRVNIIQEQYGIKNDPENYG